ncbi:DRS2 [Acanthosepion pharaonis]|uniref:DRS2 n=1 Tax=Acanthosepion pharaonis TaxID=158019 RepID=A0A812DL60_ACAPH|nr:DRS2 [Sepia pharaonis]
MFHFSSLSLSLVPKVCTQVNLCSPSLSLSLSLSVRPVPCYLPVGVISTVISAFLLFARITETASIAEKMFSHVHIHGYPRHLISRVSISSSTTLQLLLCNIHLYIHFDNVVHICIIMRYYPKDGYAFSQEEHGVIAQAELIRVYDTTKSKPEGL